MGSIPITVSDVVRETTLNFYIVPAASRTLAKTICAKKIPQGFLLAGV